MLQGELIQARAESQEALEERDAKARSANRVIERLTAEVAELKAQLAGTIFLLSLLRDSTL